VESILFIGIGLRSPRIMIPGPPASPEGDGVGVGDPGVVGSAVVRVTKTVLVTVTAGGDGIEEPRGEGESEEIGELEGEAEGEEIG